MKKVIIRKPERERIGIYILTAIILVLILLFIKFIKVDSTVTILALFFIALIPQFAMCAYYNFWKIIFDNEKIQARCFLKKTVVIYYHQIKSVNMLYHPNMRYYVKIVSSNKKTIRFRLEDENSNKAIKLLCKRFSIKDKT